MANDLGAAPRPAGDARFREELETVIWIFDQVRAGKALPALEAEAVASALYVAMRLGGRVVVPRLPLHDPQTYSAVHAINVALLAMGVAEGLTFDEASVRAVGVAGLLADIGMARVPLELINKPGEFTPEERTIANRHPSDGAAIILESDGALEVAATAAYEHHFRPDGSGFPGMIFQRTSHRVSRLVAVCDTAHALSCPRPFRQALKLDGIVAFLRQRTGTHYDAEMVAAITRLMSGKNGAA